MSQERAFKYEKYFVQPGKILDHPEGFPDEAFRIFKESNCEGVPTSYADHPELGKAVICSAGQGPMILWEERPIVCPKCGDNRKIFYFEYVGRHIGFKEMRDGTAIFDTTNKDEMDWEDSKDGEFLCRSCTHTWPIGIAIDFE
jgi:hypothetical protein